MNDITIFNHLGNNIRVMTDALKLHCRGVVKHYPIVDSLGH